MLNVKRQEKTLKGKDGKRREKQEKTGKDRKRREKTLCIKFGFSSNKKKEKDIIRN